MIIVNLTPHEIILRDEFGADTAYPSQGVARVRSVPGEHLSGPLWSAPIWGEVEGLPEPTGDVFIVSALVAARCAGRGDVFSPGTGPNDGCVRDDAGRIVAVTRLIQAPDRC